MRFSPLLVSALMVHPLRYFFRQIPGPAGFHWHEDEKQRTVDIGTVNDFNGIALEKRPRILVSRGSYQILKRSLTDNMAESKGVAELLGKSERTNTVFINGMASIIIEADQEGSCELLTDMVSHFIVWSRPLLCDTQGFNEFGLNMQVSECSPDKETKEKFKTVVSFPYLMEEHWQVKWDAIKLKGIFAEIRPFDIPAPPAPDPSQIIMR